VFDYTLKTASRTIVCGASGNGKTFFILDLVAKRNNIFDSPIKKVIYVYSIHQPIFDEFGREHADVVFTPEVPVFDDKNEESILLILDDFMLSHESGQGNKTLTDLFIRLSHHLNITLIITWQCLFPKNLKCVSINSSYLVIFPIQRDTSSIDCLNRQILPDHPRFLRDVMCDLKRTKFSYLLIDNTPQQCESFRYRNFVYPRIDSKLYVPGKHDEACL